MRNEIKMPESTLRSHEPYSVIVNYTQVHRDESVLIIENVGRCPHFVSPVRLRALSYLGSPGPHQGVTRQKRS